MSLWLVITIIVINSIKIYIKDIVDFKLIENLRLVKVMQTDKSYRRLITLQPS